MASTTSNTSFQARMNHFEERYHRRSQQLRKGRHPRSFKRDGELWSYADKSTERVQAIQKGQSFWTVMAKSSKEMNNEMEALDNKMEEGVDNISVIGAEPEIIIPKKDDFVNGYRLDRKTVLELHYGITVVVINENDEILCVSSEGDVLIKPINEVESNDRGCFKLLDITEPTNPRTVQYGNPIWLQVVEPSHNSDDTWKMGHVLSAKIFGPPKMGAARVVRTDVEGDTEKKEGSDENDEALDTSSIGENFVLSSDGVSEALAKRVEAQQKRKHQQQENDTAHANHLEVENSATGPGAYRAQDKFLNSAQMESEERIEHILEGRKNKQSSPEQTAAAAATATESARRREANKVADIVGLAFPTRITSIKETPAHLAGSGDTDKATRIRSQQSSNLGQWSLRSALRMDRQEMVRRELDEGTDGMADQTIYSTEAIFIEQDMYCLSSTRGSDFHQWPRRGLNREVRDKKASIKETNVAMEEEDLAAVLTQLTHAGKLHVDRIDPRPEHPRACLRRLVMREPPHKFVVDRRSVWRLMIVEAPGDTFRMSANEITAARVMKQAKDVLSNSAAQRAGAYLYHLRGPKVAQNDSSSAKDNSSLAMSSVTGGSTVANNWRSNALSSDNVKLPAPIREMQGGENFTDTLQKVRNKMAFRSESLTLADRRVKEAYIGDYMLHTVAADIHDEMSFMTRKTAAMRKKMEAQKRGRSRRERGTGGRHGSHRGDSPDAMSTTGESLAQMSLLTEEQSMNRAGMGGSGFSPDGSLASPEGMPPAMGSGGGSSFGGAEGVPGYESRKLFLDLDETSTKTYGGTLINQHKQLAKLSKQAHSSFITEIKNVGPTIKSAQEEEESEDALARKERFEVNVQRLKEMDRTMQMSLVHKAHMAKVERISNVVS